MNISMRMTNDGVKVAAPRYGFTVNLKDNCWILNSIDKPSQPVISANNAFPLLPEFSEGKLEATNLTGKMDGRFHKLRLSAEIIKPCHGKINCEIVFLDDRLVVNGWYKLEKSHGLAYWNILSHSSHLDTDEVQAYLGIHEKKDKINGRTWAPSNVELSTASHNWTYAGGLPRVVFKKGEWNFCLGGTDIAHDFGLELKSQNGTIEHFRFNYGGMDFPYPAEAGEVVRSPRFQILVENSNSYDLTHAAFTGAMLNDGIITQKRYRPENLSWRRPWYCTWADQMGISEAETAQEQLGKQNYQAIKDVLTQEMVLNVAKLIRKENLNIGAIIIDDGWQDFRGDWNLDESKFPDMRGLVDELHGMDFKVVLWWAPFTEESGAAIHNKPGFITGPIPKYKELNIKTVDYTKAEVRTWALKMVNKWFSNFPDGWDIDGFKLDFFVDKISPFTHHAETDYRGEERLWKEFFAQIDEIAKRYKKSPWALAMPYNPHLIPFCVAVHSEERFDTYLDYLPLRCGMCNTVIPGTWMAPHFNYNPEQVPDFIRAVKKVGGIVQVGKLISPNVTPGIFNEIKELLEDA